MTPLGCGPAIALDEPTDDGGTTAGVGSTDDGVVSADSAPPPPSTTVATSSVTTGVADTGFGDTDSGDATDGDDSTFLLMPDGGACSSIPEGTKAHCTRCDVWQQDCPQGEKCVAWANSDAGAWNATRCTEVADSPGAVGDPCSVEGSGFSGIDDCEFGAMCFYVDPETNTGTCVAQCTGSAAMPICDEGSSCTTSSKGVLNLCVLDCDPLLGDCPSDHVCTPGNFGFRCIPQVGEPVPVGEACALPGQCIAGAVCVDTEFAGCVDAGDCCTAFCDLEDPNPEASCAAGQVCIPWFAEGQVPDGFPGPGVCVVEP